VYYVYVLKSKKDNLLYIGQTNNLQNRLKRHMSGHVESTRYRRPLNLVYFEELTNRSEAMRREKFLKSGEGHKFLREKM
jgi:putative endonuclease